MSDLLEGWAYPVNEEYKALKILDHTFVKAPNNGPAYFDCFGGHDGPGARPLDGASGNGNYSIANCYRLPSVLPDTAGLIPYGIFGVCHQAANRFLYSAGKDVQNAQAYMLSFSVYGTYGRPLNFPFPKPYIPTPFPSPAFLLIYGKCKYLGGKPEVEEEVLPTESGLTQRIAALHHNLHANRLEYDPNAVIDEELRYLVEDRLGPNFEFAKIQEIRSKALREAHKVAIGDLRGESFAHEINAIGVTYLDEMENYLGPENYSCLLNMPSKVRYALIDPRLAEKEGTHGVSAKSK